MNRAARRIAYRILGEVNPRPAGLQDLWAKVRRKEALRIEHVRHVVSINREVRSREPVFSVRIRALHHPDFKQSAVFNFNFQDLGVPNEMQNDFGFLEALKKSVHGRILGQLQWPVRHLPAVWQAGAGGRQESVGGGLEELYEEEIGRARGLKALRGIENRILRDGALKPNRVRVELLRQIEEKRVSRRAEVREVDDVLSNRKIVGEVYRGQRASVLPTRFGAEVRILLDRLSIVKPAYAGVDVQTGAQMREMLGIRADPIVSASILGSKLAMQGGLVVIPRAFGENRPMAVVVRNKEERAQFEEYRKTLDSKMRGRFVIAESVEAARSELREMFLQFGSVQPQAFAFQGFINTDDLWLAEKLRESLGEENVTIVTNERFNAIIEAAGLDALIRDFHARYFLEKSA